MKEEYCGYEISATVAKYLGKSASILWQILASQICFWSDRANKSLSWRRCAVDSSVISSQRTYLRQCQWCWRKTLTWMSSLRKGPNLVGRKGHCGYLQVDDDKTIKLHDSLEFFSTQLLHPIQRKTMPKIVLNLFSGHYTTPYCCMFMLSAFSDANLLSDRFWKE